MSRKRTPEAACEGKQPHHSEAAAEHSARRLRIDLGITLQAYKCEFCGQWHLGRPPWSQTTSDARRKRKL